MKEKVREAKKANREVNIVSYIVIITFVMSNNYVKVLYSVFFQAREARKKAIEEMSKETKEAFEKMKFYKFYPVQTSDTPDISNVKVGLTQLLSVLVNDE